mmetsp:Transcript_18059/g.13005  ORF Transcript_18059/g.13005 Transcript_18059/m.13005 type:complete len:115 (-) Transcript_18059:855-1199(-)
MISIAIIAMYALKPVFEYSQWVGIECPTESGGSSNCFGLSGIVRMCFVLSIFHLLIIICSSCKRGISAVIHDGCWLTKTLIVIGSWIATFWIPNTSLEWYLDSAKWVSMVYLCF